MNEVVIATGARTPIGSFGGALKAVPAQRLGEQVVRLSPGTSGEGLDVMEGSRDV